MWTVWYKLNGELHRISCGCGPESPGYAWRCYMGYFGYGAWIEYEVKKSVDENCASRKRKPVC